MPDRGYDWDIITSDFFTLHLVKLCFSVISLDTQKGVTLQLLFLILLEWIFNTLMVYGGDIDIFMHPWFAEEHIVICIRIYDQKLIEVLIGDGDFL